jgi:hypothetical protein
MELHYHISLLLALLKWDGLIRSAIGHCPQVLFWEMKGGAALAGVAGRWLLTLPISVTGVSRD